MERGVTPQQKLQLENFLRSMGTKWENTCSMCYYFGSDACRVGQYPSIDHYFYKVVWR